MITYGLMILYASDALSGQTGETPLLSSSLSVLSAMLTPAVLILASGSLILSTSSRFGRVIDRVRELLGKLEEVAEGENRIELVEERRELIFRMLDSSTTRARILQRAVATLYVALCMFVATSVAIGIVALTRINQTWIPLALGFTGAVLLFYGCILMLIETRLAMKNVQLEMDFTRRLARHLKEPREETAKLQA